MKQFIKEHWQYLAAILIVIVITVVADQMNGSSENSEGVAPAGYSGDTVPAPGGAMNADRGVASKMMSLQSEAAPSMMPVPEPSPLPPIKSDQGIPADSRMIIRTANLTVVVKEPEKTFDEVKQYVDSIKGFVEDASVSDANYNPPPIMYDSYGAPTKESLNTSEASKQKQVSATIRVPSDKYDEAVAKFKSYGYVSSENMNGQDVTASYQDIADQLENLKAREAKVREFYAQAKNVEETMSIFKELEDLRFQIQNLETQQKGLQRQTSYSTIYLNLQPETRVEPFTSGEWNIGKIWNQAVNQMLVALRGLAEFGVKVVVYSVIWIPTLLVIWLIARLAKRYKKKTPAGV